MPAIINDSVIFRTLTNFIRVIGLSILVKLKKNSIGNRRLSNAIDRLLQDLKGFSPGSKLTDLRKDADCVHSCGFYFFSIHVHRTLVLIDLSEDFGAKIIWAGSHAEYERIFKNDKASIESWLRRNGYIN